MGTSLEWYDFFLFGATASIVFAPLFFGGEDPALAVLRIVQGMAVRGEWGGATLLAVENAPEHKRGFSGAVVQLGSPTGTILSSMIVAAVVALSGERFLEGAWRIPYLISIVLVAVGVWIRLKIDETEDCRQAEAARSATPHEKQSAPVADTLRAAPGRLIVGIGTYLFGNADFFVLTTFMISYVTKQLGLPSTVILTAIAWGAVAQIVVMFIAGKVADKTSPSIVEAAGYAIAALVAFPIFWLVDTRDTALITVAMILGLGFASIPYAPVGTVLTQLFPVKVRYSAIVCGGRPGPPRTPLAASPDTSGGNQRRKRNRV
ncbi:MFS transporter [Kocuria sp. MNB10]